jgi:hypothetical protein
MKLSLSLRCNDSRILQNPIRPVVGQILPDLGRSLNGLHLAVVTSGRIENVAHDPVPRTNLPQYFYSFVTVQWWNIKHTRHQST